MTKCFDLQSDVFKGLRDFCKGNLTEIKNEGSSKIFKVPSFFQNDATGYFFTKTNVFVLTTDAEQIEQIISVNNIKLIFDSLFFTFV